MMIKRGQIAIFSSIIIAIIVLVLIFLAFRSFGDVNKRYQSVEISNLKTSIETRILQQSVRPKGTVENFSVSVPSSVAKICFFDANKKYDELRNPDIPGLYADDKVNNFFILTDDGFFQYKLENLEIMEEDNPLCIPINRNKANIQILSDGKKSTVKASNNEEDIKCISVFNNGNSEKKIDIVFMGYGFKDTPSFNEQVNKYINNILLEFQPFNEYRGRFNFYRIDNAFFDCRIGSFIECDQFQIKLKASDCPNDYIIVLVDRSVVSDFIKPVRSSAVSNIAKINTADKPFVLVHEFGHIFGDLADEYVDEEYYSDSNFDAGYYVNCDSSPCPSWQGTMNTSCYSGCSLKKYFRPTKDSVMRTLNSPEFGPVSEAELLRRMLYYE
jgi:hypothetical protein